MKIKFLALSVIMAGASMLLMHRKQKTTILRKLLTTSSWDSVSVACQY